MASKPKQPSETGVSRRAVLAATTKLYLFGALCATVGSTIVAACINPNDNSPQVLPDGGTGSGYGSGYGYGYGHGYGYGYGHGYGHGYGYGYGYGP